MEAVLPRRFPHTRDPLGTLPCKGAITPTLARVGFQILDGTLIESDGLAGVRGNGNDL
ncbi:hypothetical protein GCM10023079_48230 [Streptomyces chitinivorans]